MQVYQTVKIKQQLAGSQPSTPATHSHYIHGKLSVLPSTLVGGTVNVLSTAAFEEGHFQTGFEAEKNLEYHVEVWGGKSRSQVVCMRIKARFPYLLSLMS